MQLEEPKIGDKLRCPVCGKEFKADEDTKYICGGGFPCSWKCFLTFNKMSREERDAVREEQRNYINSNAVEEKPKRKRRTVIPMDNPTSNTETQPIQPKISPESAEELFF